MVILGLVAMSKAAIAQFPNIVTGDPGERHLYRC